MRVDLTYFKKSGKYYTDVSYETKLGPLYDIWSEVISLIRKGTPPGLVTSDPSREFEFFVLINVPDHEHSHPRLMTPDYLNGQPS